METFIFASILFFIAIFIMAFGVLFFDKPASRTSCTTNPAKKPNKKGERCATGEAGLCPFEDKSGALKVLQMSKLNRDDRIG